VQPPSGEREKGRLEKRRKKRKIAHSVAVYFTELDIIAHTFSFIHSNIGKKR